MFGKSAHGDMEKVPRRRSAIITKSKKEVSEITLRKKYNFKKPGWGWDIKWTSDLENFVNEIHETFLF